MNDEEKFADRWTVFCSEALQMLKNEYCWDISTLHGYAPQSIEIYENGSRMPEHFEKIRKVKDGDLQYLTMWV